MNKAIVLLALGIFISVVTGFVLGWLDDKYMF